MKKLTYLISLISLILFISCGSIFAQAPSYYITSNGQVSSLISSNLTPLKAATGTTANESIKSNGYYYLDESSFTNQNTGINIPPNTTNVSIYIATDITANSNTGTTSGGTNYGYWINIPYGSSVNFYSAAKSPTDNSPFTLNISNKYDTFTIGSDTSFYSSNGNFGNITFNSGNYIIANNSGGTGIALGSKTSSGGTITVNQNANVTAVTDSSTVGATSIGVMDSQNNCNININGGILSTVTSDALRSVDVGSGKLTVQSQGKFLTYYNLGYVDSIPTNYDPDFTTIPKNWSIQNSVLGINTATAGTDIAKSWNAFVNGTITVPTNNPLEGGQVLTAPDSSNGQWASVTINPSSTLTLGTTDSEGIMKSALLKAGVGGQLNAGIQNNGNVIINDLDQDGVVPGTWNNNAGSILTVEETAGNLSVFVFNNKKGTTNPTLNPGLVNLDGFITIGSPNDTNQFTNNGLMNIGPKGYINSKLINSQDGKITSENPNYYNGTVWSMDLGSSSLTYYTNQPSPNSNVTITNDAVTQYQNVGFSAYGASGTVLPSFFYYTLTPVNTSNSNSEQSPVAIFNGINSGQGNINWYSVNAANSDPDSSNDYPSKYNNGYYISNNNWTLIMYPSTTGNSWNLDLMSDGSATPGVYRLNAYPLGISSNTENSNTKYPYEFINTATSSSVLTNGTTAIPSVNYRSGTSDSLAVQVITVTVNNLEFMVGNQVITQRPYVVDIDETGVVDFSVLALNGETPVTNYGPENWSITFADGSPCTSVAAVTNPETGVVRFLGPTDQTLLLQVTVQGITDILPIQVTGTGTSTIHNEIVPVSNPLYLTANTDFDLNNNIRFTPSGLLASSGNSGLPNVTYTLNDTDGSAGIFGDSIFTGNNNDTNTYSVTATTTIGSETLTTTFDVTFTGQTVNKPTGITAASALTFNTIDAESQNVNAAFTPANTSMNGPILTENQWYFEYTSSNDAVAIVNSYGEVTPVSVGTAVITTTITGLNGQGLTTTKATTNVTVLEAPADVPATDIIPDPSVVYLATSSVAEAEHSQTITVTLEPQGCTSELTGTISAPSVAELTDNHDDTFTVTAVAEGRAVITLTAGDITKTVPVIVSDKQVIASDITASGTTPDSFTVTVSGVQPNPAIHATGGANVSNVSIFTWSGPDQVDKQFKVANDNNGTYTYTPFQVNGNDVNTWYFNADSIQVECYAYLTSGSPVYLGAVTPNYSWVDAESAQGQNVAYITYQENNGFNRPTVFNGAVSGTVGQHLQLEGLRVSSCIEGVQVVTDVHEQNVGWVQGVLDGSYAGTQHEFRQIEAIRLRLTGTNASNYDIYYQVHAENIGWTGPVMNEQISGTVGQNRQIEAVQIQIVQKGTTPTGWATN